MKGNKMDTRKEAKDGEIRKLKDKNRRLESDKKKLMAEKKDLSRRLEEAYDHVGKKLGDISVEKVIQGVNAGKNLEEISEGDSVCPQCKKGELKTKELSFGTMITCSNRDCSHSDFER